MDHKDSHDRQMTWAVPVMYSTTGGRDRGRELRSAIVTEMQACPPDGFLLIDFATVKTLDFSAADEVVGGLVGRVLSGDLGTRRFVLSASATASSSRAMARSMFSDRSARPTKRHCSSWLSTAKWLWRTWRSISGPSPT
jgi:hypothetical protein